MNVLLFENFFAKSSFALLFLSMIFYWIQVAFSMKKYNIGKLFMIGANFSLFSFLIFRWVESGHFPLSNLYESLIFLSWSFSTFHLFLENFQFSSKKTQTSHISNFFFGAFTSPPALFTNAFATFTLPEQMQRSSSLVPALQSNWLMMHVTVMILSYSALICGSLLAIVFLIFTQNETVDSTNSNEQIPSTEQMSQEEKNPSLAFSLNDSTFPVQKSLIFFSSPNSTKLESKKVESNRFEEKKKTFFSKISLKKDISDQLDNLSYRLLGIGFPFLTIGILSGAVWANEAWGSYWSWDPKETWAFATWLVFAMYLHTRLTKGWKGKKSAFLAAFGFLLVWVCFLGVNLLGEGLHSYGFFQN